MSMDNDDVFEKAVIISNKQAARAFTNPRDNKRLRDFLGSPFYTIKKRKKLGKNSEIIYYHIEEPTMSNDSRGEPTPLDIFLRECRRIGKQWDTAEVSKEEKLNGAVIDFIKMLDGNTGLGRVRIGIQQYHGKELEEVKTDHGGQWFPAGEFFNGKLDVSLLDLYKEQDIEKDFVNGESMVKKFTTEAARSDFLLNLHALVKYWTDVDTEDPGSSVLFTILSGIDGTSSRIIGCDLHVEGDDDPFNVLYLHELFYVHD